MATMTIYASSVTGAAWTNPNYAAGPPLTNYATEAIPAGNSDTLTAAFAATAVPGTITAVAAVVTARSTVGSSDTEMTADGAPMTYLETTEVPITTFTAITSTASASAASYATLRTAIIAGTYALDLTFSTTAGATIDAKGIGLIITFIQFDDPASPGDADVGLAKAVRITHLE